MKRKYNPCNIISMSFGVKFECPEIFTIKNINKLIDDIYLVLEDEGNVLCHQIYDGTVIVIKKTSASNFFNILRGIDRHVISIRLPLMLYQKKSVFENLVDEICYENCMAKLIVDSDVAIWIAGRLKEVLIARKRVLYCIEKLLDKEPKCYKGYISSDLLLRNKVRMFFVSKINDQAVILSGRSNIDYDIEKCLKPREDLLEHFLYFDSVKLIYVFFYLRDKVEDILVENDCYLGYELTVTTTRLCIKSFHTMNLKKCLRSVKCLFQDIVKLSYSTELGICYYKMFTFESTLSFDKRLFGKYLSVGLRSEVKRILQRSMCRYEIEIDIDSDLEDFLCGKKNGKINKICKDNTCEVVLYTKMEDGIKKMVMFISGVGTDLYETVLAIEDEYPAELCFYLHERHHRRIIGYGGKNIQKIMKKHGVYIKFMSEEERMHLGYDGNVIIKTPRRNMSSLNKMKEEVIEMVEEECLEKVEERRELDLYTYYEYYFEAPIMWLNRIFVMKILPPKIMIYLLNELSVTDLLKNNLVRAVRIADSHDIYVYSFVKLELEVITSNRWVDRKPNLTFKLFDSVLLYAYEPTFDPEFDKSKRMIDFSDKIKEYNNDIFAVGNRKREDDRQTK